jgi:hypothetical protein
MKHEGQLSNLPKSWGGPFFWFRNDRGNLELIRLSDITESVRAANKVIREYLGGAR